jgi:hypothetical protein
MLLLLVTQSVRLFGAVPLIRKFAVSKTQPLLLPRLSYIYTLYSIAQGADVASKEREDARYYATQCYRATRSHHESLRRSRPQLR